MKVEAFKRAKAMFAAIAGAMMLSSPLARKDALAAIGPYTSSGKGKNRHPHRRVGTAAHARAALKRRNQQRHRRACKGRR